MTIVEAYEILRTYGITSVSETQNFPPKSGGFEYFAYNNERAFLAESWEGLVEKVSKEVASAYL
jgi:hypothetical protein